MDLGPLSTFPFEDQPCGAVQECLSFIPLPHKHRNPVFVCHSFLREHSSSLLCCFSPQECALQLHVDRKPGRFKRETSGSRKLKKPATSEHLSFKVSGSLVLRLRPTSDLLLYFSFDEAATHWFWFRATGRSSRARGEWPRQLGCVQITQHFYVFGKKSSIFEVLNID